ncbi:MAG TPA: PhnD/SsuA/transferrin family substrate-binding protein [Anaerolineales bacterium]
MASLSISTCQAPNMDFVCRDLAGYLSQRLSIPVEPQLDIPWQERNRRLDAGQIDLCWICGLPYVLKADQPDAQIELLAAPVMLGERYQNRPIYFSDVVVSSRAPFRQFSDLRGASWSYNEPGSQSGYNITRYTLAVRGLFDGFFGRVIEAGAHQTSLKMILKGEVDASAIDSTVLEQELENDPAFASQIRVIDTFGPSPIPPWVISKRTPVELKVRIKELFSCMDQDPEGRSLMARGAMRRFASVVDVDYDPIRAMAKLAERVTL